MKSEKFYFNGTEFESKEQFGRYVWIGLAIVTTLISLVIPFVFVVAIPLWILLYFSFRKAKKKER